MPSSHRRGTAAGNQHPESVDPQTRPAGAEQTQPCPVLEQLGKATPSRAAFFPCSPARAEPR